MSDRLSLHAPLLVNAIGHCAGALAFGILLWLLFADWRRSAQPRSLLPAIAAGLAFLWNLGALVGSATSLANGSAERWIVAVSFALLSLLPAVLLHVSLQDGPVYLWVSGYAIGGLAAILHLVDFLLSMPQFHYAAILLVVIGFGALTVISVVEGIAGGAKAGNGRRLAGAMVLFLFALSFAHFGSGHNIHAWGGEAILHHAGIPLALFILLQDYRFLLLDAFVRFLVNGFLAACAVGLSMAALQRLDVAKRAAQDPVYACIAFAGACLALNVLAYLRSVIQRFLTRVVFLRSNPDQSIMQLRATGVATSSESDYFDQAARIAASFFSTDRWRVMTEDDGFPIPVRASAMLELRRDGAEWARAVAPLRFSRGDSRILVLGSRAGSRRYLSEDLEVLDRFAAIAVEQIERLRSSEIQSLVSQSELRALQAQINPHFLFNVLNTLHGLIARENLAARKLVLNVADVFRYSLTVNSPLRPLSNEIRIVHSYLEIAELRLGSRLSTEFDIDEQTLGIEVPVLSIQPLVENAVEHGVAPRENGGFVRLSVRRQMESVCVTV
ncbi:MAG TPA: histidine kinase, partial [Bryobacteraceae bacterium]|nr:histidine kinase [Bryobacteraceae bacterium]